jgi:ribosomal protein S12 methylthiotransferase accessory factor YcaO
MKLGEAKDFWVLRKADTEEFYDADNITTTKNLLAARRFTDREEVESYKTRVGHLYAGSADRIVPVMMFVHIRITTEQLPL